MSDLPGSKSGTWGTRRPEIMQAFQNHAVMALVWELRTPSSGCLILCFTAVPELSLGLAAGLQSVVFVPFGLIP